MLLNLKVDNQSLAASHFSLTDNKPVAQMTVDAPAGATTLTVASNYSLAINKILLIGNFGEPTAEIVKTSASVAPTATVITLAAATQFDHPLSSPVTLLDFDQVELNYSLDGDIGDLTVLATLSIFANGIFTSYSDPSFISHSNGYALFRFKNTITSVFSTFSDPTPYSGNPQNSVQGIIDAAMGITNTTLDGQYTLEADLVKDVNEAQRVITTLRDWTFELHDDFSSIVTSIGETEYDLAGLDEELKYVNTKQSFISVRLGNFPLNYRSLQEIEAAQMWTSSSPLATTAAIAATQVTLEDSSSFQDTGTVYLRTNGYVSYTANDKDTGILSGIDAASIVTAVPAGATAWQNAVLRVPMYYTVYDDTLILDALPDADNTGIAFKFRYIRNLDPLTAFSSVTPIPFWQCLQHYVAHRILLRKRMFEEAQQELQLFSELVNKNEQLYKLQTQVSQQYYTLLNTNKSRDRGGIQTAV